MDQDEHDRLNAELRKGSSEKRAKKRKENVRDTFTALLVFIGVLTVGGFIYAVVPSPWSFVCIALIAILWLYCFEN